MLAATHPRTLVVTATTFFDVDRIAATIALVQLLRDNGYADIDVVCNFSVDDSDVSRIAPDIKVEFAAQPAQSSSAVTLNHVDVPIKELRWTQEDNELKLEIYTADGQILDLDKVDLSPQKSVYMNTFVLGINASDFVERLIKPHTLTQLLHGTVTALGYQDPQDNFATDRFIDKDARSMCEVVFRYADLQRMSISQSVANVLLTGVYWRTNAFRNSFATPAAFALAGKLIDAGATAAVAAQRVFASLGKVEAQMWVEALSNVEFTSADIALSVVERQTAFDYSKLNNLHPVRNPLLNISRGKAAFILLPLSPTHTRVLCATAFPTEFPLRRLFKNNKYYGDDTQGEFNSTTGIEDTKQLINRTVSQHFDHDTPAIKETVPASAAPVAVTLTPQPKETKQPVSQPKPAAPTPAPIPTKPMAKLETKPETPKVEKKATEKAPAPQTPVLPRGRKGSGLDNLEKQEEIEVEDPLTPADPETFVDLTEKVEAETEAEFDLNTGYGFGGVTARDPLPSAR